MLIFLSYFKFPLKISSMDSMLFKKAVNTNPIGFSVPQK